MLRSLNLLVAGVLMLLASVAISACDAVGADSPAPASLSGNTLPSSSAENSLIPPFVLVGTPTYHGESTTRLYTFDAAIGSYYPQFSLRNNTAGVSIAGTTEVNGQASVYIQASACEGSFEVGVKTSPTNTYWYSKTITNTDTNLCY